MNRAFRSKAAFSLVEVLIAVGIIALALIPMIGLLGAIMGNARETATQNEALQTLPSLNDFLQRQGFTTVYGWAATPSTQPAVFAYTYLDNTTGRVVRAIVAPDNAAALLATTSYQTRRGRMFRAVISFSKNPPPATSAFPTGSPWPPASQASYTSFVLPLHINLYSTPEYTVAPAPNNLVTSYETAVFR